MTENTIEKYLDNNNINIEKLINDYSGYIYVIVKNITKETLSNEDIEEIISDVFVVCWNNRFKINKNKLIKSYLAGITKNLIKLKYRKSNFNLNIDDFENSLINKFDINEIYENYEKNKMIELALEKMKKEDKEIFLLYYYNSRSIKEISEILNISISKVKTKLFRIRKKLKSELIKGGYDNGK